MPCFPVATASPKRAVGIDATGLQVPAAGCSREVTPARASDASGLTGPRSRSQAWPRATASNIWRLLAADGFIGLLLLWSHPCGTWLPPRDVAGTLMLRARWDAPVSGLGWVR